SGGRGPTLNIGQKQHRGRQNDQDKSQCEAFNYKSHVHPRKKGDYGRRVYHREVACADCPSSAARLRKTCSLSACRETMKSPASMPLPHELLCHSPRHKGSAHTED